eukprot:6318534-Prymnesium_polylepis.1
MASMVDMVSNNAGDRVVWDRAAMTVHCHDGRHSQHSLPAPPPASPPSPSPPPPAEAVFPANHRLVVDLCGGAAASPGTSTASRAWRRTSDWATMRAPSGPRRALVCASCTRTSSEP